MNYVFLIVYLTAPLTMAFGQYAVKGIVMDSTTGTPLEYASVVNLSANIIVYTDQQGKFELLVNAQTDKIQISNMGYKLYLLSDLIEEQTVTIKLAQAPILIEEVSVKKRKLTKQSRELGFHNDETASKSWGPGGEVASTFVVLIKNPGTAEGEIDKEFFKLGKYIVGQNGFSKARVRVMGVNPATGLPGDDLLRENNIISINPFSQSFSINLEKYHIIYPKEGVFVGLEFFCQTIKKEPRKDGSYTFKTNCPHIASATVKDYATKGGGYYNSFDFVKKTWKWVGISNGELSKAFTYSVFKFGIRVNYYD